MGRHRGQPWWRRPVQRTHDRKRLREPRSFIRLPSRLFPLQERLTGPAGQLVSFERRPDFAAIAKANVVKYFGDAPSWWTLVVGDLSAKAALAVIQTTPPSPPAEADEQHAAGLEPA